MMNISWKRVWILIKKWRLFIISSAIAVLSLIFVIKTYGKTNESCKLIIMAQLSRQKFDVFIMN